MSKKILIVLIIISVIFAVFKIIPMLGSEEEKIRKVIIQAKAAVEKENPLKCISYVSMAYSDRYGNGRGNLLFIAQNVFKSYNGIFIVIEDMDIDVKDEESATAKVLASGQGRRQDSGELEYLFDTDRVEVDVNLKKEEEGWRVAELEFIQPSDFMQFLKGL